MKCHPTINHGFDFHASNIKCAVCGKLVAVYHWKRPNDIVEARDTLDGWWLLYDGECKGDPSRIPPPLQPPPNVVMREDRPLPEASR